MKIEDIKETFYPSLVRLEKIRKKQRILYYMDYLYYAVGLLVLLVTILILLSDLPWWCVWLCLGGFLGIVIGKSTDIGNPEKTYEIAYGDFLVELMPTIKGSTMPCSPTSLLEFQKVGPIKDWEKTVIQGQTTNQIPFEYLIGELAPDGVTCKAYFVLDFEEDLGKRTTIFRRTEWVDSSLEIETKSRKKFYIHLYSVHHQDAVFNKKYTVYAEERQATQRLIKPKLLHCLDSIFREWDDLEEVTFENKKIYLELNVDMDFFIGNIHLSVVENEFIEGLFSELEWNFSCLDKLSTCLMATVSSIDSTKNETQKGRNTSDNSGYDDFIENGL